MESSAPECPRCHRRDQVHTFEELYTFQLHTSPKPLSLNPFNLFTDKGATTRHNDNALFNLAGGCLVAIIGFLTIPLRNAYARKTAPQKEQREQEGKAERLRWRQTLATWPVIYGCKRDMTAFFADEARGVPAAAIFRMLQHDQSAATVTSVLRGEQRPT